MWKNKRLLLVTLLLMTVSSLLLGLKIGYPHHRVLALVVWLGGWIPAAIAYHQNRRRLRVHKAILKKKARPFLPHFVVALVLSGVFYAVWVLFPPETSPLVTLSDGDLRTDLDEDVGTYRMLCKASDDWMATLDENELLRSDVADLRPDERVILRGFWRDGVMAFLESELLRGKYRGFYQVDYLVKPTLHADAFFIAYATMVAQHDACLQVVERVGENPFLEVLLNEAGDGIPGDTFFAMKQRVTHPKAMLRLNAAAAYYKLVRKDIGFEPAILTDFETRRRDLLRRLGRNAEIFVDHPLEVLERTAFTAWFPVQKQVAVQMSYLRTTRRDYYITPEILDRYKDRLQPGDILVERRNWHLTNVGIPGFWPHTALYVGTPKELESYFAGLDPMARINQVSPAAFEALFQEDADGYARCVVESIRPGVVLQSLETSARCDYLGVIRPHLSKEQQLDALLSAFTHFGKPYDLNFDFTTDGALVCSELVYKAYSSVADLPLTPEVISGRMLLSPNRMVEQVIANLEREDPQFSFVFFLDASEKDRRVDEADLAAFKASWARPKWDVMQE